MVDDSHNRMRAPAQWDGRPRLRKVRIHPRIKRPLAVAAASAAESKEGRLECTSCRGSGGKGKLSVLEDTGKVQVGN